MAYFTRQELEDAVSAETLRQALDDNNDGVVDTPAFTRLAADATSYVDSFLRGIYTLPLSTVPNLVKMLALQVAKWMLWQRHPECARSSWADLKEVTDKDLVNLRKGVTRLDVEGAPEPAANQGGLIGSGNVLAPDVVPQFFTNGTGIF